MNNPQSVAATIAETLRGWTVKLEPEDYCNYVELNHESGLYLRLRLIWNKQDRFSANIGGYPCSIAGEFVGYDIDRPGEITASLNRPTAALVKDIDRRLIAPALATLPAFRYKVRERNAYLSELQHARNVLESIPGISQSNHDDRVFYGKSVSIRLDNPVSLTVDIRSIPLELAALVVRFVATPPAA